MPEERACEEVWTFVRQAGRSRTSGLHRLSHHRGQQRRSAFRAGFAPAEEDAGSGRVASLRTYPKFVISTEAQRSGVTHRQSKGRHKIHPTSPLNAAKRVSDKSKSCDPQPRCSTSCAAARSRGCGFGLLHGRMSADDKEVAMARFKRGEIDVLVATTVIEVGVDVAERERYGDRTCGAFWAPAQMHQLRGRVGRGAAKSCTAFCLPGSSVSPDAEQRLDADGPHTKRFRACRSSTCSSAARGSSSAARQAGLCQTFASPILLAIASCWNWPRWRLRGSSRGRTRTWNARRLMLCGRGSSISGSGSM